MKRLTTIICCAFLAIAGVALALQDIHISNAQRAMATNTAPVYLDMRNKLPLDLQLDLDKRLSCEPSIKDSINIIDSVRWVTKTKWKTRYKKNVADRTTAREAGAHLSPVNPDSMMNATAKISTTGREEQPVDIVGTTNVPSIQLTVDGKVVYSRNDNHSTEESQ